MSNESTLILYLGIILISSLLGKFLIKNKEVKIDIFIKKIGLWEVSTKKIKIYIALFPLALLAAVRVNTGADYEQYCWNFYKLISSTDKIEVMLSAREPLYIATEYIAYLIGGDNYTIWFSLMSIVTLYFLSKAMYEIMGLNIPLFIILFGLYAYLHTFNYVRQMFACMIIVYAIINYIKFKNYKFYILILLASMMHQSSIIFVGFPLYIKYINKISKYKYHVFMICSVLLINPLIELLKYVPFFSIYTDRYFYNSFTFGIGFVIDIFPVFLLYCLSRLQSKSYDNDIIKNILIETTWMIIPMRILSYITYAVGRLFIDIAIIAILGYTIQTMDDENNIYYNLIAIIVFIIYFIINFYYFNNSDVFPYSYNI